jgi:hypothetical protein
MVMINMQIVIKKTYFDNIRVAIDAMNNFFASSFKTKAFPVVNDDFQLDRIVSRTLSWLNNVEPEWVENPQKAVETLENLKAFIKGNEAVEKPIEAVKEEDDSDDGGDEDVVQEFTLIELIATCAIIGAGSAIVAGIGKSISKKKHVKDLDKRMFTKAKLITRSVDTIKNSPVLQSSWSFDEPEDSDKSHDWFWNQVDLTGYIENFKKLIGELKGILEESKSAKTAVYEAFTQEYDKYIDSIKELGEMIEIPEVNNDTQKFITKEEIENIKKYCDKFEEDTRAFMLVIKDSAPKEKGEEKVTTEAAEEIQPVEQVNQDSVWSKIFSDENKVATDMFHAFVGFKVLQFIADHFDKFDQLLNGVYSFELFTKPSQYRDAIQLFTSPIPLPELDQIEKFPGEYKLFDAADYIGSIFDNDQIKLPEDLQQETEVQRFQTFTDIPDAEVVVDETVQEAATANYFQNRTPNEIQFECHSKNGSCKWKISKKFESLVNKIISDLRKCDTTDDLMELFSKADYNVDMLANNVIPCILLRVFDNPKKYPKRVLGTEAMSDYLASYRSISTKNNGAKRFERIDLFSTFKTDKEGTIKFIEDFLKLNLINDENAVIMNNTLLTVFNIFDSRIYFDLMYGLATNSQDSPISKEYSSEDEFVKAIRARVNKNSRAANPYQKKKEVKETVEGSNQVAESVIETLKEFGDVSISDLMYCEQLQDAVYNDIATLGDALYNKGISPILIDRYIGESHDLFKDDDEEFVQEGVISKLKEKSSKKKIIQIERYMQEHLPKEFIQFINSVPKKLTSIGYDKGGCLGHVFGWGDILACIKYTEDVGKFSMQNKVLMFAEYMPDGKSYDDSDPDSINVLWLNAADGAILVSDNPFNMDNLFMSDLKPFEPDTNTLLEHLDDWEGKPSTEEDEPEEETEKVDDVEECGDTPTFKTEDGVDMDPPTDSELSDVDADDTSDTDVESVTEQETGDMPAYLKDRIKEDNAKGDKKKKPTVTDAQLPPDVPMNDPDDLADSIDTRLNDPNADSLGDMLGAGYNGNIDNSSNGGKGTVVYNITNNYTNSHNTSNVTTDDHSTGKSDVKNNTSQVSSTSNDLSTNKRTNSGAKITPTNNYDNTRPSSNSKDENTFSTGKSVQEVFALLTSEEPLFVESAAGNDVLTDAMSDNQSTVSTKQKLERGVQKLTNTGREIAKPVSRTKNWLTKFIDSLIKRDENQVKKELTENPSYRSALYKVARIALKTGKLAIFTYISPYLGIAYGAHLALRHGDRERLRKEADAEIATEIRIIDDKIENLKAKSRYGDDDSAQEEIYKLMRMRQKLVQMGTDNQRRKFSLASTVY